jgi:prepilin signal peptidase PulO-like enzyme (type II secretory pathway)
MQFLIYFFIFVFGLIIGSFLNAVIYRLSVNESFLIKPSYCPHCKHKLSWLDLFPVLSFLLLKGKCRYCGKPISIQYPLVELATGFLFVFIFIQNPITFFETSFLFTILNLGFLFLVSCFLIIIFVYDLKHYIIPDRVIYPAIVVAGVWQLVSDIFFRAYTKYGTLNTIYSALGAAGFFLFIVLISKGKWMGGGDIKLAFVMGLLLGFPNILVALFIAFMSGAIVGSVLIVLGKKGLKSEVPFGPFLVFGTFLAMFFSQELINFYIELILIN